MTDGRQRARTYTHAGLRVIPVSPETKRPRVKGFDAPTFTAYQRVKPDDMVAILCGACPALGDDWLCCLDLDGDLSPEGLAAALGAELPDTLATHDGKHLWYRVEPGPHRGRLKQWAGILGLRKGWAGPGKAPDADVRWCGGYAREFKEPAEAFDVNAIVVLPAETVEAIVALRPASDDRETEALGPVRDLADDSVEQLIEALVPAWPEEGQGRHDAFLALGGMLRRQGISASTTRVIATAIVEGTGSDRARAKDAVDAWTRTDAGQPAYGWTELSSHLHGDAETLLEAIDAATADPWVKMMAAQWPPPRPLASVAEASPVPDGATAEAALQALPEWASDHVRACQEELRTPLALNIANALGVLSCAVSGRIKVRIHANYTAHTCLFVCSVAPPGELKSPSFRLAAAPIKAWVAERQDAEREDLQKRLNDRAAKVKMKEKLIKEHVAQWAEFAEAQQSDELTKLSIELMAPEPEPFEFLVEDVTPEALSDMLATHGRIACLSSDASKVFNVLGGQYSKGQADLGVWLEAYDGSMPKVHRIGRKSKTVEPRHEQTTLSAVLSIQPQVLERITGNAAMVGEGLVQRFCWVMCQSEGRRWAEGEIPAPVPPAVAETWDAGVRFLLDLPSQEVRLSAEAFSAYVAWRDELEGRLRGGDLAGEVCGWASKHLERTARIAAVLWACDGAEGDVSAEHMARAMALGRWLLPHAVAALQGSDTEDEQAVLRWVEKAALLLHNDTHAWIKYSDLTYRITPKRLRQNTDKVLKPLLRDLVGRGALEATAQEHGNAAMPKYRIAKCSPHSPARGEQ
jgi:hypothetical protein